MQATGTAGAEIPVFLPGSDEPVSTTAQGNPKEVFRDPVVFQRYEYKYIIPPALMESIRSFIRPYCDMDPYANREGDKFYTIRTLYLDTAGYKTYWDVEQEIATRFKLRVRTYGKDSAGPVKFEIKRRFNDVFHKTSVVVPGDAWPGLLTAPINGSLASFTKAERSAFENFIRLTNTLGAKPKMLIYYERQAFQSRVDRYVRISFDRRICHQPKSSYDLRGRPANWVSNDDSGSLGEMGSRVILELKFMTRAPVWLSDMVHRFELVRRGYSKYCTAVTRTLYGEQITRELAMTIPSARLLRRR